MGQEVEAPNKMHLEDLMAEEFDGSTVSSTPGNEATGATTKLLPPPPVEIDVIDIDEDDDDEEFGTPSLVSVSTLQGQVLGQSNGGVDGEEPKLMSGDTDTKMEEILEATEKLIENGNTGDIDIEMKELKGMLKQIGRKELEEIILKKIIESINSHTVVGNLRAKCLHLHGLKDKIFQKSGVLQKQVTELSKALKQFGENAAKKPADQKPPPPLKFYRSVGLQVNVETFSKGITRSVSSTRMTDSSANVLMKQISNSPSVSPVQSPGKSTVNTNTSNFAMNTMTNSAASQVTSQSQGLKRINKPTITVAELRNQVGRPDPPKVARTTNIRFPQQVLPRNPAATAAINSLNAVSPAKTAGNGNGLIDLTDDRAPGSSIILNQNGVQYRVLNQSGIPPGMQLVSSSTGYHLVSPQGQTRNILFQQAAGTQPQKPPTRISPAQPLRPIRPPLQQQRPLLLPNRPVPTRIPNNLTNGQQHHLVKLPVNPTEGFTLPILPSPATPLVLTRKATKDKPPQPELTLQEQDGGIVLSWTHKVGQNHAEISSYQIFACQQPLTPNAGKGHLAPAWKRVGDVKALPLPMACTLSQFSDENRYHFIVRGLDVYNRSGAFCEIVSIVLRKKQ